jgi:pilus assembly protein CpaC
VAFLAMTAVAWNGALADAQTGAETAAVAAMDKGASPQHMPAAALNSQVAALGQQMAPAAAAQQPVPAATAQQSAPPPPEEVMPSGAVPLRVMVGKSILVNTADRLKRVSVTDPAVADAIAVTPNQILVHGRTPGEVSLIVWNQAEQSRSFDLRVDVDATAAAEDMKRVFPREDINVSASRNSLVLSGHVATKDDAERAGLIASAFSKSVLNVLEFGPVGADEILLEVHFAEVNRTALTQLGVNLFSTGAANTFGATSTQQFGPFTGAKVGAVPSNVNLNGQVTGNNIATGAIGNTNASQPGSFGTNNLLNIFLFRSDINLGAIIQALQQKNVLQVLAEPNLIAVNGKEASFLAGGEFPYPVSQGISGAVTIQWKEFGVRLKFLPMIMPNGNIHLQVAPEVSALDYSNGLTISGFAVPGLSTRRAQTEVELGDGQSFVIAGLLDNNLTNALSKMPGVGDIPVLGNLFKSKNLQKSTDELMVLVTARRVSPSLLPAPLPKFPQPFLDQKTTTGQKPAAASH